MVPGVGVSCFRLSYASLHRSCLWRFKTRWLFGLRPSRGFCIRGEILFVPVNNWLLTNSRNFKFRTEKILQKAPKPFDH